MTKQHDRRVKQSLEAARLRLKGERHELLELRRDWLGERQETVAALRGLCAIYGDNDWPDETPLKEIVEQHLGRPLERGIRALRRQAAEDRRARERLDALRRVERQGQRETPPATHQRAPVSTPVPAPRPLRPTPVPEQEHRCIVVRSELRGQSGHRARCICGWASPHERTEELAVIIGDRHCVDRTRDRRALP